MYYHVNSAQARPGKLQDALQLAAQLAAYVNANYPAISVEVVRDMSGHPNMLHWIERFTTLAEWEDYGRREQHDPGFKEIEKPLLQAIDYENSRDHFYSTIS